MCQLLTNETALRYRAGKHLIILGFVAITILFLVYARFQDPELMTPNALESFQRMAYEFYVILLLAFGAISIGLYQFHRKKAVEKRTNLLSLIAQITWNPKSRRVFLATFAGYGIFFSLTSGTLVYQPEVVFSYHYGVTIPSAELIPCCDLPGYMPKILVYLTEHLGLQIIPLNLVLQIIVSYLVGLNTAIAINAFSISRKQRSFTSIGAATGLFIACPTCMGSFLSVFVGTASGIALSIALIQLQTLLIGISIPLLIATPFIMANKIKNSSESCNLNPK